MNSFRVYLLVIPLALLSSCKEPPAAETCADGIKNQDETEIDCGGSCQPCAPVSKQTGAKLVSVMAVADSLAVPSARSRGSHLALETGAVIATFNRPGLRLIVCRD